jgi:hypothetical protein
MFLAPNAAHSAPASSLLLSDPLDLTPRLALRRRSSRAKALGVASLSAGFVLGAAQAMAAPKTMLVDGESYFNVGDQNAKQLASGAMELTFVNGQSIVIPAGEYGYNDGQLYISEKHLPYELAHAVMTPEQVDGYIFSKTATAEGLSPVPAVTPETYTVVRPTYLTQFAAAGVVVLAGAAIWYLLTKIGDAPAFEYPIYTLSVDENTSTSFYTALAKDLDSQTIVYSLRDDNGTFDNEHFTIDSETGALSFITPPNFEAPADDDRGNVYDVKIDATDSDGGVGSMLLHVTVNDVSGESNAVTLGTAENANAFGGSAIGDDVTLTGAGRTASVTLGTGQDFLNVDATAQLNGATLSMGEDDDFVSINQTNANTATSTILLGAGDDLVSLNTDASGVYDINLGAGSDTVRVTTNTLAVTPSISLFTSDDTIDLSTFSLTNIDTTATYTSLAMAQTAVAGTSTPEIAYASSAGDTYVVVNTDNAGAADITLRLVSLESFDTDSILL